MSGSRERLSLGDWEVWGSPSQSSSLSCADPPTGLEEERLTDVVSRLTTKTVREHTPGRLLDNFVLCLIVDRATSSWTVDATDPDSVRLWVHRHRLTDSSRRRRGRSRYRTDDGGPTSRKEEKRTERPDGIHTLLWRHGARTFERRIFVGTS